MSSQDGSNEPRLAEVCQPSEGDEATDHNTIEEVQMTHKEHLSDLERTLSRNSPILASLLLHLPTSAIFQLYHTSSFLRRLLQSSPLAWKYLSFRLFAPSVQVTSANAPTDGLGSPRPSKNYALDQLLLRVVNPFSSNLKSLELDNTAVSGQILTSTVLLLRRETLEHVSVRGCKNVSLKYHLNPYLNVFGLQHEAAGEPGASKADLPKMALKSLYTYRCRHHRRRPYLPSSLSRRDSDSEPTHELVTLCHKLGIWTDTAWCTTPGNRCYRRRNYLTMRVPSGTSEVWVVFDRLWRSKNWMGPAEDPKVSEQRDGRSWEQEEFASDGEALGFTQKERYREGKATPAHLRASHTEFVTNIHCDNCGDEILERCEQCSVLMHCAGCRKTLCASCAFDRPYSFRKMDVDNSSQDEIWWAPGYSISPSLIGEHQPNPVPANGAVALPALNFKWCCTQPMFSGGGGMSFAPGVNREAERVRASPLPRGQGWEDPEFTTTLSSGPSSIRAPPPPIPGRLTEFDRAYILSWLLGPLSRTIVDCPRNLCTECHDNEVWKVHCKACSRPLCMEHDLRGLKLRICGFKELGLEKVAVREQAAKAKHLKISDPSIQRSQPEGPVTSALQLSPLLPSTPTFSSTAEERPLPERPRLIETSSSITETSTTTVDSDNTLRVPLHQPLPSRSFLSLSPSPSSSIHGRPPSAGSASTVTSRSSSPASVCQENPNKASATSSPAVPVWTGCLSFFCPAFRTHGDMRPRCTSQTTVKECASCTTFVCGTCIAAAPPPICRDRDGCKCSGCQNTFYCPNCQRKRMESGQCKRIEEEKKEKEERIRKARLEAEERRQKEKSDWVVGLAGDFWGRLESDEDQVEVSPPRHGESSLEPGFATSFEAASTHHGLGIQDDDRDLDQEHADMLRQFLQRPNRFAMAVGEAAADVDDDDDDEGDEASDHTVEAGG